jgi:hypothetical protein
MTTALVAPITENEHFTSHGDHDATFAIMQGAINRFKDAAVDAVIDTRGLTVVVPDNNTDLPPENRIVIEASTGEGTARLTLLDGAHDQLADKVGIDHDFYNRLLNAHPDLLAVNLNTLLHREPESRLLRMMKPISETDGERLGRVDANFAVRAVLGAKYRPLDHASLLNTLLPVAQKQGLKVAHWHLDPKRFHVRFVAEQQDVLALVSQDQRAEYWERKAQNSRIMQERGMKVGEIVSYGAMVRNSETGHSSLAVEPFAEIIRCLNGLIVAEAMRVYHTGRKQEETEDWLSGEARRLDDAAIFLKVRDRFVQATNEMMAQRIATTLVGATAPITTPFEVPLLEFVSNVGVTFKLNKKEVGILQEEVVNELRVTGAPVSRFAISQGLTATARRIGDNDRDFLRRADLERIGWRVLEDPVEKLLKAGREQ